MRALTGGSTVPRVGWRTRSLAVALAAGSVAWGSVSPAWADGFVLKLGGDALFEAGFVEQSLDAGLRAAEVRNRARLLVTPIWKADNGLSYGARLRLRATHGQGLIETDRAFLFAEGMFGRVEAGIVQGPNKQTGVTAPIDFSPYDTIDLYRNWISSSVDLAETRQTAEGSGGSLGRVRVRHADGRIEDVMNSELNTRVNYFSPRFDGFQVAFSYQARSDSGFTEVDRARRAAGIAANTRSYQDVAEVAGSYSGTLAGVGVDVSAAYVAGTATGDPTGRMAYRNLASWQAGLMLYHAGVAVGASYVSAGDSGLNAGADQFRSPQDTWTAGGQYVVGPWITGITWQRSRDPGRPSLPGERRLTTWTAGFLYTVAPGLQVGAEYNHFDARSDLPGLDQAGSIVILRNVLRF